MLDKMLHHCEVLAAAGLLCLANFQQESAKEENAKLIFLDTEVITTLVFRCITYSPPSAII